MKLPLRGLPRVFRQTDFSQSKIKEPFTHQKAIDHHLQDKQILLTYSQTPIPNPSYLTLLTWVIADGWGDLFAQLEAAKCLSFHFPHLHITLLSFIHKDRSIPQVQHDYLQHILYYTGKLNGPIIYEALSKEQLQQLNQSDMILEMPTPFPHIDQILSQLSKPHPTYERLGEHSLIDTIHYHPTTTARCMGLHFLEQGIFIKEKQSFNWSAIIQLKNPFLLEILLCGASIENYRINHCFQFVYLKSARGWYIYLLGLLTSLEDDVDHIDICCLDIDSLIGALETHFKQEHTYPLFKEKNIREIQIHYKKFQSTLPIQSKGKILRLIHCESLAHNDVLLLTSLTDHLIGTTGDQSLLEAIATGKPFFYDPPRLKRPFLYDLCLIAKYHLNHIPSLTHFLNLCFKNPRLPLEDDHNGWVSEEYRHIMEARLSLHDDTDEKIGISIGNCLKDLSLPLGFIALRDYLNLHHRIDPLLCGLVAQGILNH